MRASMESKQTQRLFCSARIKSSVSSSNSTSAKSSSMEGFLQKTVSYNIFISQNIPNMEIKKRIQATHLVIMATDKLVPDRFG